MTRLTSLRFPLWMLSSLVTAPIFSWYQSASAAEPKFVGVLALAVEEEGAKRLKLSEETLEKLLAFIDEREEKAVNLVQQIRTLPAAEQEAKLRPFREESEKLALQLLTVPQREIFNQMRLASRGMDALTDPQVTAVLTLTEEQQKSVKTLLAQRSEALTQGNAEQQAAVKTEFQQKLVAVLTAEQRTRWEKLTGMKLAEAVAQNEPQEEPKDEPTDKPQEEPAETAEAQPNPTRRVGPDGKIQVRFNFRYAPWKEVLDWFAEQAELSLQMDYPLQGTFNYIDKNYYNPDQAIDVMNGVLLTKGFTLIRRQQQLLMVNLEDEVPDVWVEFVTLEDLGSRGHYELVKCLFQLDKMTAEEAQADLQQLIGPHGKIMVFPAAKQIMVQETGGQLRRIQKMIESVEKPRQTVTEPVTEYALKFVTAESILPVARVLMGLNEEENRGENISMAVDPLGTRIFATGSEENLAILKDLIARLDIDPGATATDQTPTEQPQLMTHPIQVADPDTTYQVLQTLLQGLPEINMTLDASTNKIIARAPPSAHRIIQETIRELEGEVPQFEIISLKTLDPTVALAMIGNMFGGDPEAENPEGPKVTADPTTMKLFVRAKQSEIDAIQQMITRLESENSAANGGNLRLLPYTGNSALEAVQRAERFWTGDNQIRIVTPLESKDSSLFELRETSPEPAPQNDRPEPTVDPENQRDTRRSPAANRPKAVSTEQQPKQETKATDKTTQTLNSLHFVSQLQAPAKQPAQPPVVSPQAPVRTAQPPATAPGKSKNPEIRVEMTANGLLVYCEDTAVLDRFEQLLRQIAPPASMVGKRKITVFYLKYIQADVASAMVQQVLSGGDTGMGGVGSLVSDMTSNLLGGGGGLMGMLLGGGGGAADQSTTASFQASGTVSIVPDVRLNALIVQANAEDIETVEGLLKVIDKESSETEVQTKRKPRLIPVIYTSAENIAAVIKEVYADRISGGSSRSGQSSRQPSPEDFIRALRGGGRGGSGGSSRGGQAKGSAPTMTVGVDAQSNSIVISANDQLFSEVEDLVRTIDQAGTQTNDTTVVRSLKFSNPAMIQKALTSILGDSVQTSTTSSSGSSRTGSSRTGSSRTGSTSGQTSSEDMRRRMEFFQRLQQGGSRGGFGAGGRGSSTGGRGFGGSTGGFGGSRGSSGGAPSRGSSSGGGSSRGSSRGGSR